jgi:pilus assembly protein Flp/PilA
MFGIGKVPQIADARSSSFAASGGFRRRFQMTILEGVSRFWSRRTKYQQIVALGVSIPPQPTGHTWNVRLMSISTFKTLIREESRQDLIEYALVAALIAFGAITTMNKPATGISTAFSTISSDLTSAVS